MPTIFISHSCKDNEQAPPSTLSPQDAAARTGRLAFSRKLRAAMVTALEKDPRYKVFLDVRGGLKPGDIWQDGLHRALRTCSAGLVLLTPESTGHRHARKRRHAISNGPHVDSTGRLRLARYAAV